MERYRQGVMEIYQGEVLGEAMFSGLLASAAPQHKAYFEAMLQMETETKARLRPLLVRHGLSLVESEEWRAQGYRDAARLGALGWEDFLATFTAEISVYIEKYQDIADLAPAEDRPLLGAMVEHERKFVRFAVAELTGRADHALEAIADGLVFRPDGRPGA